LTRPTQLGNNTGVPARKTLAAVLLLITAMVPELVWATAHLLEHDGHSHEAEESRHGTTHWSALAEILVHGHQHREGTSEHEHRLLPSPSIRQEAPRHVQAPAIIASAILQGEPSLLASNSPARPPLPAGSSPPLLHLLCVLLI